MAAITRVYTLPLAAEMLGEDAELLWEIYIDMAPEDGCLWVHGPDDQQIPAFTDFGLESLTDFIREHKANRSNGQASSESGIGGDRRVGHRSPQRHPDESPHGGPGRPGRHAA